jgi:hypothetical protein
MQSARARRTLSADADFIFQIEPRGACRMPICRDTHVQRSATICFQCRSYLPFAGQTFQTCACRTQEHAS